MNQVKRFHSLCSRLLRVRAVALVIVLLASIRMFGDGWTPTDAGFVLNFETGDQFLLSVEIDGTEYFVCDHQGATSNDSFNYAAGNYLKLIPMELKENGDPMDVAVWTIGDKLVHDTIVKATVNGKTAAIRDFTLDGICYTMWSENLGVANPRRTLKVYSGNDYQIFGELGVETNSKTKLCDVAFVVPSNNARTKTIDPENTLGRVAAKGDKFNGLMGYNTLLKRYYREVYWFAIPRYNQPISYANAAVLTFNRTSKQQKWYKNTITCDPGRMAYAYEDHTDSKPHHKTPRTIFRIYPLNKPFTSCDGKYFFGWDKQDYVKYRKNKNNDSPSYTTDAKIYTLDHFNGMSQVGETSTYRTDWMQINPSDSTYFYVGYNNAFIIGSPYLNSHHLGTAGTENALSKFRNISTLRVKDLAAAGAYAPAPGAYGRMVVEDASVDEANLGVTFEPKGYFFRTSNGVNAPMHQVEADPTTWVTDEVWTIDASWMDLSGEVRLQTGAEFSATDTGAVIKGWTTRVKATSIPVYGRLGTAEGLTGWARIHTNSTSANGGLEFVPAITDRYIHYDLGDLLGTPIQNSYPPHVEDSDPKYHKVTVKDAKLDARFTFLGWAETEGGDVVYHATGRGLNPGDKHVGDEVELTETGPKTLYAVATYNDAYRVAFSFMKDGKRYYLTHPSQSSPRLARARHFTDWTNVYQGMSDDNNSEPNYLSTYKMIHPTCSSCAANEVILDPRHEMVYGVTNSLMFYENWKPADDEFIGLFHTTPNAIIANDTWAGAFQSTAGWPTYSTPVVNNTKLYASYYFVGMKEGEITKKSRDKTDYVKYNATRNSFDCEADPTKATEFQIATVVVADDHYVILPDTTNADTPWQDRIVFEYHEGKQLTQDVWSKLIGKKLMACMVVDADSTYFHPDDSKTKLTANELLMSLDYRLRQSFNYIRDVRASIADEDTVTISSTSDDHLVIRSGMSSPIDIEYKGEHIDIVDTLRVWLQPLGDSKIKDYLGRWKTGSPGLHVMRDGSRYRDILIVTKTYHYSPERTELVLTPEKESYTFSALGGSSLLLNFTVQNQTFRLRHDADHVPTGAQISSSEDVTAAAGLAIISSNISFISGGTYFSKSDVAGNHATITTLKENTEGVIYRDTAIITTTVTYGGVPSTLTARVPLMQVAMYGQDLLWSVMHDDKRYFIVAGTGGLMYREFSEIDNTLYKIGTSTELIVGSADAANSDNGYITPWRYTDYGDLANKQLYLQTLSPVNRYFSVESGTPGVNDVSHSILTYEMLDMYVNEQANYEERVKIKYGDNKWLKFNGTALVLTDEEEEGSVFSWAYLKPEYGLENDGAYPDHQSLEFHIARTSKNVQTRYKAFKRYSMLLNNTVKYLGKSECTTIADLIDEDKEWKTHYDVDIIADGRTFDGGTKLSGLSKSTNSETLVTTVSAAGASPTNVMIGGKYVDIVDTLDVQLSLKANAPTYHFAGDWSGFTSVDDARLKIPLICKTYHSSPYDSVVCTVEGDEYRYSFPTSGIGEEHEFTLNTFRREGTNTLDVDDNAVGFVLTRTTDMTSQTHLASTDSAQVRLSDISGQTPDWCEIKEKTDNTVTIRCKTNGIRSPRMAYLHFAYVVKVDGEEDWRYVNMRITITQPSLFDYANNQQLAHSSGYTGDELDAKGMQRVHENTRILYYYNPAPYNDYDQQVELPVRERGFMGWWRWYREGDSDNLDVPDSDWLLPPSNVGKYNYPFRRIGNEVPVDSADPEGEKKLVTMGRYTVFHIPASEYNSKKNPPSKNPRVVPPSDKARNVTYAVDISNYYDNLPLSLKNTNQIDLDKLETMRIITEPTLSLREVFVLRPWTEMADTLENYKSHIPNSAKPLEGFPLAGEHYMEDHVMMAPTGTRLLLRTEQRYKRENLAPRYDKDGKLVSEGHSESLLGYYMRDDNWSSMSSVPDGDGVSRQDTMIWCGGWDAQCEWFTYDPTTGNYTPCDYTITVDDDFLDVPAKGSVSTGNEFDVMYYCLRARSKKTTTAGTVGSPDPEEPLDGDNWFNICRYKIIYHRPTKYGPKQETDVTVNGTKIKKALITNDEIEQTYEVLERLNFDYNKPGKDYAVYPRPLPWPDASYGYSYPDLPEIPNNRIHNDFAPNFPGQGEYGLINRIPTELFSRTYWNAMEQHGGAENGYMIYCDGMSSAGQVAALSLETQLCQGQKIYFSGYVGNPYKSSGSDVACPNFTFSVQGSDNGTDWEDLTSYTTGDIPISKQWYQIYFPIEHEGANFAHYRVRIYNMASNINGNDFVLDDLCLFATKPPLIAYQANTKCVEQGENDSITNVVLRVDYQGFTNEAYNNADVYYTVEQKKNEVLKYVYMTDGYMNGTPAAGRKVASDELIYGYIHMPAKNYTPAEADVFSNLDDLVDRFEETLGTGSLYRQGYIYEHIDGVIRPVMYVIHQAKMTPDNKYKVRMSRSPGELTSSICAMTSELKVTSLMTLELNGEEKDTKIVEGMCPNTTYEISMRVKGTLHQDNTAPIDLDGSCMNDWLLFGDTAEVSSTASQDRYGYKYSDIVKVVKGILRYYPGRGETNANLHASTLADINRNVLERIQSEQKIKLSDGVVAYTLLSDLVNKGFLVLYQPKQTVTVTSGNYVQYVVFPIKGTGSDYMHSMDMEVCPTPLFIKLGAAAGETMPMTIGGVDRTGTPYENQPVVILADSVTAARRLAVRVDSKEPLVAVNSVELLSTNDPNFVEGLHVINLQPDRSFSEGEDNYSAGDDIILTPGAGTNYHMRQGYNYTFGIVMQTTVGALNWAGGCPVGTVMFTVSVVPSKLMWSPAEGSNEWYKPTNWIGVDDNNNPIHANARYAPLSNSSVIIPALTGDAKYPKLVNPAGIAEANKIKQAGYEYNTCDKIRFMPEAAINQQQLLSYNKAVVDMKLPQEKWALRSAPVMGMIAGDIFMSNADLAGETAPWEVGEFDANGRNDNTGNASFWLSMYNREIKQKGNGQQVDDSARVAEAAWTRCANAMLDSLYPAQGWAVFTATKSGEDAIVRLPKTDDTYYYYYADGKKAEDFYEHNLQALRNRLAGGSENTGKLIYNASSMDFTLTNGVASTQFVFGNPTMGYIDIWHFIDDNSLNGQISYIEGVGDAEYITVTKETAKAGTNALSNRNRYLPPMHAMVVYVAEAATSKTVTLAADQIVTAPVGGGGGGGAPARYTGLPKGFMKVTAVNPADASCRSHVLIGQGYHKAILDGEDAVLATINVDDYTSSAPFTPFNLYALEAGNALSIDLLDDVQNVPISFYMSDLPFEPVTKLWFTGVNNIDGQLVLYDALTGTERLILDGICLSIQTPEVSYENRYYIRRQGWTEQTNPVATDTQSAIQLSDEPTTKLIRDGHVLILRGGHVYTVFGQKLR